MNIEWFYQMDNETEITDWFSVMFQNVQQICHYVDILKVVDDNSWQFNDTHNSNQQLNGRDRIASMGNHNTNEFWFEFIYDVVG